MHRATESDRRFYELAENMRKCSSMNVGAEKRIDNLRKSLSAAMLAKQDGRSRRTLQAAIKPIRRGFKHRRFARGLIECTAQRSKHARSGQALVEFTLVFMLMLVVAWIPADFGLAFMTGQLASNASREGARIAAASNPIDVADVRAQTCKRLSMALFSDPGSGGESCPDSRARVQVTLPASGGCNEQVTVAVTGNYNYSFYRFLQFFGVPIDPYAKIERTTTMRWEHQNSCT
jgi:Flp pilus assembly protein TadG